MLLQSWKVSFTQILGHTRMIGNFTQIFNFRFTNSNFWICFILNHTSPKVTYITLNTNKVPIKTISFEPLYTHLLAFHFHTYLYETTYGFDCVPVPPVVKSVSAFRFITGRKPSAPCTRALLR